MMFDVLQKWVGQVGHVGHEAANKETARQSPEATPGPPTPKQGGPGWAMLPLAHVAHAETNKVGHPDRQPKPAKEAKSRAPAHLAHPAHPKTAISRTATPAEHLAGLGGHDGALARFGIEAAHRLWDSARLWERDRDTPLAARWETQYWATLERLGEKEGTTP